VLQGMGGGGLQPSEQSILADTFPPKKLGMAFAMYGMAVVVAPAIGPTLGGFITDNYSWRWIFYINVPIGIISLLLTSRLITDPPHLSGERAEGHKFKIDYIGLGLLALGLGTLQVVLDKGQRLDWFESHFITYLTVTSVVALVLVVFWEWRHENPVIDLKLFRDRSFAIGNSMMFMLGFILLATTLLLPLFSQTMLGYTAREAGLSLMPGGFVILMCMPVVGFLLSRRTDPRWLMAFGLSMLSFALFHMTNFDLNIDFMTVAMARVFQGMGLAFLFVPINTVAYSYLPRNKNNAASGLINLARNVGGSIGISFVTTMLARRTQTHRSDLTANLNPANPRLQAMMHGATSTLRAHSGSGALQQAYGLLQGTVERQATMLSYIDNFRILGIAALFLLPCVLLVKKPRKGAAAPAH
jgi:DHA2 family multidrug resistance protein